MKQVEKLSNYFANFEQVQKLAASWMTASQTVVSWITAYLLWTSQKLSYFLDFEQTKKNVCRLFAHAVYDNMQDTLVFLSARIYFNMYAFAWML